MTDYIDEHTVTVGTLIEWLGEFDPQSLVVLQKDAEGNGYSPLYAMGEGIYVPDSHYSGEFHDREDLAERESPDDLVGVLAVVLAPRD